MEPLRLKDKRQVEAAQGWVGLGSYLEAEKELAEVTPELQGHPDVLKVRWEICSAAKNCVAALDIATLLIESEPESPLGWIYRSHSLHQLKRTGEARENLLRAVERFPKNSTLRYKLACYECQLGNLAAAGEHLSKAFRFSGSKGLKLKALEDPDLELLWREHRITRSGRIRALTVDLSVRARRKTTAFILSLAFWATASAGVAWRNNASTRVDWADAGLSAAGVLFAVSLFLLLVFGLRAKVYARMEQIELLPGNPLYEITGLGFAILLGSLTGGLLALFCGL